MSEVENELLELPIQDLEIDENLLIISTDKQNFAEVLKEIEKRNYHITEGDLQFIPENEISLDPENSKKFFDLIDAIE
jgi:transcriptional/translational regulatory protein YebC/TACO1